MAKQRIFAAHDAKLGVFLTPFFFLHLGQALRAWQDVCNNKDSLMGKHPSDFVLYEIGVFDEETGLVTPHSPHHRISSGLEAKNASQDQPTLPLRGV